jgi:hypothetical protein
MKNVANKCVDAEKTAGSRVLLTQHPRPSRFSGPTVVMDFELAQLYAVKPKP